MDPCGDLENKMRLGKLIVTLFIILCDNETVKNYFHSYLGAWLPVRVSRGKFTPNSQQKA